MARRRRRSPSSPPHNPARRRARLRIAPRRDKFGRFAPGPFASKATKRMIQKVAKVHGITEEEASRVVRGGRVLLPKLIEAAQAKVRTPYIWIKGDRFRAPSGKFVSGKHVRRALAAARYWAAMRAYHQFAIEHGRSVSLLDLRREVARITKANRAEAKRIRAMLRGLKRMGLPLPRDLTQKLRRLVTDPVSYVFAATSPKRRGAA